VAEVVVLLERAPAPLRFQVTPALFLSLVTAAVRVMESAPSTVVDDAVIATLKGLELPPHPKRYIDAPIARAKRTILFRTITLHESYVQIE